MRAYVVLKKHYAIILAAVVVAAFMYLPQYWLENDTGDDYQGVYANLTDSENYYTSRVAEIYDGHYNLGNAHLAEYKDLPYVQPPLPELIYAGVGKLMGLDRVEASLVGSRIIIPILLTLMIYAFIYALCESRLAAFLGSLGLMLGLNLVLSPQSIVQLFQGQANASQGLSFSRPVSPQVNSLFLFGYLLLFWQYIKSRKDRYLVSSAIILGLLFYIYYYSWSFLLAHLGVLFILSFIKKDLIPKKKIILHLAIALIIATPYFINVYHFYQLPQREILTNLQGLIHSRELQFGITVAVGLAVLAAYYKKDPGKFFWWFFSLLFAGLIAVNQQLVTGLELHNAHYHWYINTPLVAIMLLVLVYKVLYELGWQKTFTVVTVIAMPILLYNAYLVQRTSYDSLSDSFLGDQRYGKLYEWLNTNTTKDSVVLQFSPTRADNLPVYTHNNVFISTQLMLNDTPQERIEQAFYFPVYLEGVTSEEAESYFKTHAAYTANLVGGVATRRKYGCRTCFPESEFFRVAQGYREFLSEGIDNQLSKYELDYLVEDTQEDSWPQEIISKFDKIAEFDGFRVYRKKV